jgi:hypothetical protein
MIAKSEDNLTSCFSAICDLGHIGYRNNVTLVLFHSRSAPHSNACIHGADYTLGPRIAENA